MSSLFEFMRIPYPTLWDDNSLFKVGKLKIPENDIRQLSYQWRAILQSIDYPSVGTALRVLNGLTDAYFIGRGYDRLSMNNMVRHEKQAATLTSRILFNATELYEEMAQMENSIKCYLEEVLQNSLTKTD